MRIRHSRATGRDQDVITPMSRQERVGWLQVVPGLDELPTDVVETLADELEEAAVLPGEVVVREGEVGGRLLVLVCGQVEVSTHGRWGPIPLALLGPGEFFGELALLSDSGERNATVTALAPTRLLSLGGEQLRRLLTTDPQARASFEHHVDRLLTARFVREVGPFGVLSDQERQWLADRLVRRSVPGGTFIVRQGDLGDRCFMIRSGQVEVLVADEAEECRVAILGPGSLFGEAALLSETPRTASVRALESCELLELDRTTLQQALERDETLGHNIVALMRLRERPRRAKGVVAVERLTPEGDAITILKNPRRLTYYRLSERGRFIWDRLDGGRNVRDLTLEYLRTFDTFAPAAVAELVAGLARAGFVEVRTLAPEHAHLAQRGPWWQALTARAKRVLEWRLEVRGLDQAITTAYKRVVWLLYTRIAQLAMVILALTGIAVFVAFAGAARTTLGRGHIALSVLVIPAFLLMLFVHEAGHAFTAKAYGREVHRAGVGWYWLGPVFFVDTSDMWLSGRRERIAVNLAGPYATLVLGGALGLVCLLVSDATVRAAVWTLMLPIYLSVLFNLNPLLEYDGYYVLTDLLDRPNLRVEALLRVRTLLPTVLQHPSRARGHWLELGYGLASLLYIAGMAGVTIFVYRVLVQAWIARALPEALAADLAWTAALLVVALMVAAVLGELHQIGPAVERS